MGLLFTTLILIVVVMSIVGVVRGGSQQALAEPEVVEEPPHELLPEALVEPFGDVCTVVTGHALELYKDYREVERLLEKKDGGAPLDAAKRFELAQTVLDDISEPVMSLLQAHPQAPDEARWWGEHTLEQCDFLRELDGDDARISGGMGGARAQGALRAGLERIEQLLLGADDFARRMLDFELEGWVEQELGGEKVKLYVDAIRRAHAREQV